MSQARLAPRTTRSAQTRERIIAAATEVFARSGFHGAKVADIAERAGIAYGLVYHYFHNKDDLLAAIFTERWAEYVSYLHEVGDMEASENRCAGSCISGSRSTDANRT
jgi:TetR/AcrR family fatty acid metabolism transcriptional regulator